MSHVRKLATSFKVSTSSDEEKPLLIARSDKLNVEESEREGLPDNVVRFRNMPLAEEMGKRAWQMLENYRHQDQ